MASCAPQASTDAGTEGEWVGSVSREGNVTTVVNESGSVWGGNARMLEEASIGVEVGEEPYLFSNIGSLWATPDRIFILDNRISELRAFDRDGTYMRTLAGAGEGPGELQRPREVLVADDGRIFVLDSGAGAFLILSPNGNEVGRWPVDRRSFGAHSPGAVQLAADGGVWAPAPAGWTRETIEIDGRQLLFERPVGVVLQRYGDEGVVEERPVSLPELDLVRDNDAVVPFTGRVQWVLSPTGDVMTGVTSEYRFTIHRPDGSKTIVERHVPPSPIDPDHFAWAVESQIRSRRRRDPGWSWDPAPPDHQPYYRLFLPDQTGRIWVVRPGPTEPVDPCDASPLRVPEDATPRPCFRTSLTADVFDREGRFLGSVDDFFGNLWTGDVFFIFRPVFIDGDTALFTHEDEVGTIMVKRYRLRLPAEEGE